MALYPPARPPYAVNHHTLVATVANLLVEVGHEEVLPRFGRLRANDIATKDGGDDPNDLVTAVDHLVEARLSRALRRLIPRATVIGEEAVHAGQSDLDALRRPGVTWLIDPLDGTHNFAAKIPLFGTMIALVVDGETEAAWIHLPLAQQTFAAIRGGGSFCNGQRLQATLLHDSCHPSLAFTGCTPRNGPRGATYTRYMPPTWRGSWERASMTLQAPLPQASCAAAEYTDLVQGRRDFVVYYRTLPWDHAAGVLLLQEAGGVAKRWDGSAYAIQHTHGLLLLGRTAEHWQAAHAAFTRELAAYAGSQL